MNLKAKIICPDFSPEYPEFGLNLDLSDASAAEVSDIIRDIVRERLLRHGFVVAKGINFGNTDRCGNPGELNAKGEFWHSDFPSVLVGVVDYPEQAVVRKAYTGLSTANKIREDFILFLDSNDEIRRKVCDKLRRKGFDIKSKDSASIADLVFSNYKCFSKLISGFTEFNGENIAKVVYNQKMVLFMRNNHKDSDDVRVVHCRVPWTGVEPDLGKVAYNHIIQ